MHAELKSTGTTSGQALARQESAIEEVQRTIEGLQAFQQQSSIAQSQRVRERERSMLASTAQLLATQRNIQIRLDAVQAAAAVRTAQGLSHAPRQPSSAPDTQPTASVMLTASLVRWKCLDPCTCMCHRRYTTRSPQFLSRFLGLLFLGYAGLPMITPSCDSKECTQRASPVAVAAYYFPLWLLARVVSFTMKVSHFEGPQFSLRVSRVIDGGSSIFGLVQNGETSAVKELLQQRITSPFDISHTSGYSALMVSQPEWPCVHNERLIICG